MHSREEKIEAFGRALDIMDILRERCPWNAAQTVQSLRPMTIEEAYELSDAILKDDAEGLCKELGDVLLHVIFYSKIAQDQGSYDIADVLEKLCQKMIFRHPHVFPPEGVVVPEGGMDAKSVSEQWEIMKTKEKGGNKRVLSGIPDTLPPILKALSMQEKASGVGFDWEERSQVWDKVREEQEELAAQLTAMEKSSDPGARENAEEELGDQLFALINAARLYGLNPDTALSRACEKFRRRFTYIEEQTLRKGRDMRELSLSQMDAIWDEAKAKGL